MGVETNGTEVGNCVTSADEQEIVSKINNLVTKHGDHILNFGMKKMDAYIAILSALENLEAKCISSAKRTD